MARTNFFFVKKSAYTKEHVSSSRTVDFIEKIKFAKFKFYEYPFCIANLAYFLLLCCYIINYYNSDSLFIILLLHLVVTCTIYFWVD